MEQEKIISKSKYKRKDHKRFYMFHSIFRSSSSLLILFVVAFLIYFSINTTKNYDFSTQATNIIITWSMTGATLMIIPLILVVRVNEVVKQETSERVESTDTMEVSKVKIQKSNDKIPGKVVISWSQIEVVCETPKYIYLYTGPKQGMFIVKEDIIEGDIESFRKLAFDNLKKRKGKVPYKTYFMKRIKKNAK